VLTSLLVRLPARRWPTAVQRVGEVVDVVVDVVVEMLVEVTVDVVVESCRSHFLTCR